MKSVFITGGAKSGKSDFARLSALKEGKKRLYIATATALDDEMAKRIAAHKKERGIDFDTLEEPEELIKAITTSLDQYDTILVDCLTLWISNIILKIDSPDIPYDIPYIDGAIKGLIEKMKELKESYANDMKNIFFVSNEVGMSIVPDNHLSRLFRDKAGTLNQRMAAVSDEVFFIVSGMPLKLK